MQVPVTKCCGAIALEEYINYVLLKHEKGLSWEGEFDLSHFREQKWRYGLEFYISLTPESYSHGNMRNDLRVIADCLIPRFSLRGGAKGFHAFLVN